MIKRKDIAKFRVDPGEKVDLKDYPTTWKGTDKTRGLGEDDLKELAARLLKKSTESLAEAQERLYANDVFSVLLIFQAMDAAGKDGMIKHVMSGVNPQGCQVFSFKRPSEEELDHNFLWRCARCTPERGRIGIFNRSYYEEVLVVNVHPELLERQKLPPGKLDKKFWQHRYEDINAFERHLARNGTLILKFFLHVSKDEQKKRFLKRIDDPAKRWKFAAEDIAERAHWKDYMRAYATALTETSTKHAPWYVIPADRKYIARALVADIVTTAIRDLDVKYPELPKEKLKALLEARRQLERE